MLVNPKVKTVSVGHSHLKFELLHDGKIHQIKYQEKMINQLRITDHDEMFANLYLRIQKPEGYVFKGIVGDSSVSYTNDSIMYEGHFEDVDYKVNIHVLEQSWFIDVKVGACMWPVDIFYVQDIGIKNGGGIRNNEAYNSQYIDHKVFETEEGYKICSKQNQGANEYVQIGSLTKTVGYETDGYQFFGLDYKFDGIPKGIKQERLDNEIYQYEFAVSVLQSAQILSENDNRKVVFYGYYVDHYEGAVEKLEYQDEIKKLYHGIKDNHETPKTLEKTPVSIDTSDVYTSATLTKAEIELLYPNRRFEEVYEGQLLSFFDENHSHIVLQEKERHMERMHGHIILNGDNNYIKAETIATTSYMPGVFNAQVVLGNTSFNRFISNTRNMLNMQKTNGQRLYVKVDGKFVLLGMPASYEMGFNYQKWLYKLEGDLIEVLVYTNYEGAQINLEVKSFKNKVYDWLLTQQIVMGSEEMAHDYEVTYSKTGLVFKPVDDTMFKNMYKNANFHLDVVGVKPEDLNAFHEISLCMIPILGDQFKVLMYAGLDEDRKPVSSTFEQEQKAFMNYYQDNINHFNLSTKVYNQQVDQLNTTMYWYTHDALIHYQSPHGLEQFGGAAWGTRDVCQGPFEYFLSNQKFDVTKKILIEVYKHQFMDNGDWPQWFMFDKYYHIQAKESHGDIIVWPLRSLALYLEQTHDLDILDETLSYTDLKSSEPTKNEFTLLEHVKKAVDSIVSHYIPNTHLSSYGDGDWDDTLQPANPELRKSMVSGWTIALTYETFNKLGQMIGSKDQILTDLLLSEAKAIEKDYQTYVMKDDVPAGFLHFGDEGIRYIIHPTDDVTHMKYRLLPMNRGIISEMFSKAQAEALYNVIENHLKHPDGVRLMDRTVDYHGGKNTYFKRAETSANFGREIGLQYVHAHIRYIEAMAQLGKKDEVFKGLLTINPILIQNQVKNADFRQSNAYFSSSDGAFLNRYEAMKDFNKLFTGDVKVKGGWRVYSSGPGIYINQIIAHFLGFKKVKDGFELNPSIPSELDGLTYRFKYLDKELKVVYHLNHKEPYMRLNDEIITLDKVSHKYHQDSLIVNDSLLKGLDDITLEYFG